jgi:hypothetical protein
VWFIERGGVPIPVGVLDEPPPDGQTFVDGLLVPDYIAEWLGPVDSTRALRYARRVYGALRGLTG